MPVHLNQEALWWHLLPTRLFGPDPFTFALASALILVGVLHIIFFPARRLITRSVYGLVVVWTGFMMFCVGLIVAWHS